MKELWRLWCWLTEHDRRFVSPRHNYHCVRCDACGCRPPYQRPVPRFRDAATWEPV